MYKISAMLLGLLVVMPSAAAANMEIWDCLYSQKGHSSVERRFIIHDGYVTTYTSRSMATNYTVLVDNPVAVVAEDHVALDAATAGRRKPVIGVSTFLFNRETGEVAEEVAVVRGEHPAPEMGICKRAK